MHRLGGNSLILAAIGLVAGLVLATGAILAHDESGAVVEKKGNVKVVVVDEDGNRHEETFEFDDDHPRPFLGVRLSGAAEGGARVEGVVADTAAERAGLREGDVIVGYDGEKVETARDLTRLVLRSEPGDRVDVELMRDGERQNVTVEIGERTRWMGAVAHGWDAEAFAEHMEQLGEKLENMEFHFDADAFQEQMEKLGDRLETMEFDFDFDFDDSGLPHGWMRSGRPLLGVELVNVTPELREHLGGTADAGLLVGRVRRDFPAAAADVRVGDLIVAVDDEPLEDIGDLRRALRQRQGQTFDLEVIRDGRPVALSVTLPEPEDEPRESGQRLERRRPVRPAVDRT